MRAARDHRTTESTDTASWRDAILDDLLSVYIDWRESARAVADAYARWSLASGPEGAVRFAAYTATLDQEQKTAATYADAVADLKAMLVEAVARSV